MYIIYIYIYDACMLLWGNPKLHILKGNSAKQPNPISQNKQFGTHLSTVVCGGPFTTLGQTPPRNGGLIVFGVLQKWRNIFGQNGEYQPWFWTMFHSKILWKFYLVVYLKSTYT